MKKVFGFKLGLLNVFDSLYFGDFLFEEVLDALLERHHRHGAACAVSLKLNFHDSVFKGNEFYVSAVGLKLWPNQV